MEFPDAAFHPQRDELLARVNEQNLEDGGYQMPVERVVEVHLPRYSLLSHGTAFPTQ